MYGDSRGADQANEYPHGQQHAGKHIFTDTYSVAAGYDIPATQTAQTPENPTERKHGMTDILKYCFHSNGIRYIACDLSFIVCSYIKLQHNYLGTTTKLIR